ncbi:hypothetical protein ABTC94_20110, partial [Acinetobacter baumannii]
LILFSGGRLPLDSLQPFHALLALASLDRGVWERVQVVYGLEDLLTYQVRVVLETLGYPL